jgi:hypothetical protein
MKMFKPLPFNEVHGAAVLPGCIKYAKMEFESNIAYFSLVKLFFS